MRATYVRNACIFLLLLKLILKTKREKHPHQKLASFVIFGFYKDQVATISYTKATIFETARVRSS